MTEPSTTGRILVVEDDRRLRAFLGDELEQYGHEVRLAAQAAEAIEIAATWTPDLVLSDLRLPGPDGLELLDRLQQHPAPPSFILVTAFGSVPQAVDALQRGAADFITKPIDYDHLQLSIGRALETRRLRERVQQFEEILQGESFHGMVGECPAMRDVFHQAQRIAPTDGTVLLLGESGTGKDLLARAVHAESPRAGERFVAVNAAGLPEGLQESELFGHEAGAFTGARERRTGLFAEADGGTLFLDEIGEMPLPLQAKLLRVLEDGQARPVGSDRAFSVDVRIITATNRDLREEVDAGQFRRDLYFRLETFTLHLPPLRDRGDDLERLVLHLLKRHRLDGSDVRGITPQAMQRLEQWSFPGNVRELQNVIEWAVTFCDGELITESDLPSRFQDPAPPIERPAPAFLDELGSDGSLPTLAQVEAAWIEYVLDQLDGNKRQAAKTLGISRRTLYRRLEDAP